MSMDTNSIDQISEMLTVMGQPVRIQILLVIREKEACVCHLEAVLGIRQSGISQHLMALRKAGLVTSQRIGRNIYYSLNDPHIDKLLADVIRLTSANPDTLTALSLRPYPHCPCPQCHPERNADYSCQNLHPAKA